MQLGETDSQKVDYKAVGEKFRVLLDKRAEHEGAQLTKEKRREFYKIAVANLARLPKSYSHLDILAVLDQAMQAVHSEKKITEDIQDLTKQVRVKIDRNK